MLKSGSLVLPADRYREAGLVAIDNSMPNVTIAVKTIIGRLEAAKERAN